ncbi:TPA: DUF87 domain-containing protein [Pseudomonas aeruginosa]|nr:DUF87 domain-containing protein [Pseudomonas aeruginosa]
MDWHSRPIGDLVSGTQKINVRALDLTKNLLVLGGTGSGKTTRLMRPILKRLVEQKGAGLVLDVKGDYGCIGRGDSKKYTVLSVSSEGGCINIISGFSPHQMEAFLSYVSSQRSGNITGGGYWGKSAVQGCMLVWHYVKEVLERHPTLADFYYALVDPRSFKRKFDMWQSKFSGKITPEFASRIQSCKADAFSIISNAQLQKDSKWDEQNTWHAQQLIPFLEKFAVDKGLEKTFCGEGSLDFDTLIYKEGKSVVLDLPSAKFGESAYLVGMLLRMSFFQAVFNNRGKVRSGCDFTFMLIDEYQGFAFAGASSNKSGLIDDNTWLDRSRSFNNINVFATQGVSSLKAQIGVDVTSSLVQNFRNVAFFSSSDSPTISHAELLCGKAASETLVRPDGQDKFLFYSSSLKDLESAYFSGSVLGGELLRPVFDTFQVSQHFEHPDLRIGCSNDKVHLDSYDPSTRFDVTRVDRYRSLMNCELTLIPHVVYLVSGRRSCSLADIAEGFSTYPVKGKRSPYIQRINVTDMSSARDWYEALSVADRSSAPGELIVVARGGGDESDFAPFSDPDFVSLLREVGKDKVTIMAVGHVQNRTLADRVARVVCGTPSLVAAAYYDYFLGRNIRSAC